MQRDFSVRLPRSYALQGFAAVGWYKQWTQGPGADLEGASDFLELQLQPSCKLKTKKKKSLRGIERCEGDFKGKSMKFSQ